MSIWCAIVHASREGFRAIVVKNAAAGFSRLSLARVSGVLTAAGVCGLWRSVVRVMQAWWMADERMNLSGFPAGGSSSQHQLIDDLERRVREAVARLFVRLLDGERTEELVEEGGRVRMVACALEEAASRLSTEQTRVARALDLAALAKTLDTTVQELVAKSVRSSVHRA